VVCLQHEFGIYGGTANGHVLALDARPSRTCCQHVAHSSSNAERRSAPRHAEALRAIEPGRGYVGHVAISSLIFGVPEEKIDLILRHSRYAVRGSNFFKDQFNVGASSSP
jgi:hypothetical protein